MILTKKDFELFIDRKNTKFQSNSQHIEVRYFYCPVVYRPQKYKISKQFTTNGCIVNAMNALFTSRKQNFKAIHNVRGDFDQKKMKFFNVMPFTLNFQSDIDHSFLVEDNV